MFKRASNFLDKSLHKHRDESVLFVTHDGIGKILVGVITGKSVQEGIAMKNLSNTSVSIFEIDENS